MKRVKRIPLERVGHFDTPAIINGVHIDFDYSTLEYVLTTTDQAIIDYKLPSKPEGWPSVGGVI